MNKTVLTLVIVGALNWLLIGLFQFDLVAAIFGGQSAVFSRIIYCIIGLAGIWAITFWRRVDRDVRETDVHRDGYHSRRESLNYEFGDDYTRDNKNDATRNNKDKIE
jgi:uncharacterized membrane protein YuzA (DUF378 family)